MKHLTLLAVLALVAFASITAQNSIVVKPKLFGNHPEKLICTTTELDKVFVNTTGATASFSFADNFLFDGTVMSNTTKYGNMQSVVIKLKNFADAILNITRITKSGGQSEYRGYITHSKYSDGYSIKQTSIGNYQLVKFETDKLLQDCKQ